MCVCGDDHSEVVSVSAGARARPDRTHVDVRSEGAVLEVLPCGPMLCNCVVLAEPRRAGATGAGETVAAAAAGAGSGSETDAPLPAASRAVVIDPGGDAALLFRKLQRLGLEGSVQEIIVTHAHIDHFLAAGELRSLCAKAAGLADHSQLPIALHKADKDLWDQWRVQCRFVNAPEPTEPLPAPDRLLSDGDNVGVLAGRVIHTPGHTPGSLCVYFEQEDLVCTGDTLFLGSVGRTDLWGGDASALLRSIDTKLAPLDDDVRVIPGHGAFTSIGFEKATNPFLQGRRARM